MLASGRPLVAGSVCWLSLSIWAPVVADSYLPQVSDLEFLPSSLTTKFKKMSSARRRSSRSQTPARGDINSPGSKSSSRTSRAKKTEVQALLREAGQSTSGKLSELSSQLFQFYKSTMTCAELGMTLNSMGTLTPSRMRKDDLVQELISQKLAALRGSVNVNVDISDRSFSTPNPRRRRLRSQSPAIELGFARFHRVLKDRICRTSIDLGISDAGTKQDLLKNIYQTLCSKDVHDLESLALTHGYHFTHQEPKPDLVDEIMNLLLVGSCALELRGASSAEDKSNIFLLVYWCITLFFRYYL